MSTPSATPPPPPPPNVPPSAGDAAELLRMEGVRKTFPGVAAWG
ncbi:hypothetical protein AB4Z54_29895 [Streptomyces sp. MCAF7]